MRKSGKFFVNMTLLTISGIAMSVIGMAFRSWFSKIAGAEVLGLHQLLYSVYLPACTLACSGINIAVTRLVASCQVSGMSVRSIMRRCLGYSFSFGLLASVLLFGLARPIETFLLREPGSATCLRILSAGLPFLSSVSALHGMFTALRKVYKSVIIQLTEDLSKIAVSALLLLLFFRGKSVSQMCISLVAGSACAETLSCVVGLVFYLTESKVRTGYPGGKGISRRMFGIALPTATSAYIRSALSAFENLMIPVGLRRFGLTDMQIYRRLGVLHGMVMPTIMFPSVILSSCSRLLVPEISEAFERGDRRDIARTAATVIKMTLVFSFIVTAVFIFFADGLGVLIYGNNEVGTMLRLMAPLVPLMYIDGIIDSMLKGINEQLASMRVNIIDSAASAVAVAVLLPQYGFEGYFVITYVTCCLNAVLSLDRFLGTVKMKIPATEFIIVPLLIAFASVFSVFTVFRLLNLGGTVLPIALSVLVYIALTSLNTSFRRKKQTAKTLN